MNTPTKLAAFAAAIAVTFGAALAVGAAVGPIDVGSADHTVHSEPERGGSSPKLPRGLSIVADGYRFVAETTVVQPDRPAPFSFRVVDADGAAVTHFRPLHARPLHLIVVSRGLGDYHHLHPVIDDAGQWSVELPALAPGSYRMFADFQPDDADNVTLGVDITVPGATGIDVATKPSTTFAIDGYMVTLAATPAVGDTEIEFTVATGGITVRTEPYLGASGHLVAIRAGDLAYLHVHPYDTTSAGVPFTAEFPSAGTYRLFFDFAHNGTVRTAAFTVVVADVGATNDTEHPTASHDEGH